MSITLIPISAKDIEIFRGAVFARKAIKAENRNKIKQKLADYYSQNPKSREAALSYAAFNILPGKSEDPFDQKEAIEGSIEAFKRVLEMEKGHWLSRYYIAKLQSLFDEYYDEDDYQLKDIDELIALQNQADHKPYFILPYILKAKLLYNLDRQEEAIKYIETVESFPKEPVKELPDFLGYIFIEFENKLRVIEENEMADRIKKLGHAYFPEVV